MVCFTVRANGNQIRQIMKGLINRQEHGYCSQKNP